MKRFFLLTALSVQLVAGSAMAQNKFDHQHEACLGTLSKAGEQEFKGWDKPRQLAFLINAYNAFMIEKVLTRYPDYDWHLNDAKR